MKKALLLTCLAVAIAAGVYRAYFYCAMMPTRCLLAQPGGELEWVRREYHLTDAQFARVQQVHGEYAEGCDVMCARIAKANAHLDELIKVNSKLTPEVQVAFDECMVVQSDCRRALLAHIYAVSAEMSAEDGARYMEMMKCRVIEPGVDDRVAITEAEK